MTKLAQNQRSVHHLNSHNGQGRVAHKIHNTCRSTTCNRHLEKNKHLRANITPYIRLHDLSNNETQSLWVNSDGPTYAPTQITLNLWHNHQYVWDWRGERHVWGRKVHTGFCVGNLTKGNHLKDQSTEGIIKMDDLKSWLDRPKTGLIWLATRTRGVLLWPRWWTYAFR